MIYMLLVAVACNAWVRDWRMLCLTMLVAGNVNFPIPDQHFYFWCACAEAMVLLGAISLRTAATRPVCAISATLIACHYLGWRYNGYPPESPYYVLVTIAEHANAAACALFSKLFLGRPNSCRHRNNIPNG